MNFLSEEQAAWRESVERWVGREYIRKRDMERYFREGMQSTVGGGTSRIQRTLVAQEMRLS